MFEKIMKIIFNKTTEPIFTVIIISILLILFIILGFAEWWQRIQVELERKNDD